MISTVQTQFNGVITQGLGKALLLETCFVISRYLEVQQMFTGLAKILWDFCAKLQSFVENFEKNVFFVRYLFAC